GTLGALKPVLYTLPEGSWTQREPIRERITDGGVRRCTTKFTGTILSRLPACATVRGKPSRMKEALGEMGVVCCDEGVFFGNQPLDLNSEEIRSSIIESGTRLPDCMTASALRPVHC